MRPRSTAWVPEVLRVSSRTGLGVPEVWTALQRYREALVEHGELAPRRAGQSRSWLWDELRERVMDQLRRDPAVTALEADVVAGRRTPTSAADELLKAHARESTP